MSTAVAAPPSVTLTRTYHASRERIFSAWTDPKQLAKWFAPSADYRIEAEADPRIDGSFRIHMHNPNGNIHTAFGEYKELKPPSKLAMTWAWTQTDSANGSLVTVELRDLGDGSTELTLTHAMLSSEESRASHEKGWAACLHNLAVYLDPETAQPYTGPKACS